MEKRWNIKRQPELSEQQRYAKQHNIDPILAQLLMQREIGDDDVKLFFHSDPIRNMHNPLLMKDMQEAVDRIILARDRGERILIYGDYDVDGTTAVSLVYQYLTRFIDVKYLDYYIPDRYNEGYGISFKGIDYAKDNGITLVIALDCGIKAVEKVRYATERGIDFIICDHHMPGDELPQAVACLDPKRSDCNYPDKNLSGCGVGFKLMQALCRLTNGNENELLEYLDLLVVSIASDIVPMIGENRILAHHGLKRLNSQPSVGLKAIIDAAVRKKGECAADAVDISISDIVFKIGPRINAVGRLHTGREAVDLLTCRDAATALELAECMGNTNEERKELDRSITEEAKAMVENSEELKNRHSTVLFNPAWHKGVIGIVASRMTEDYYRPTIILTESNGMATGSARSVEGFDLYKAIDSCSDLLENFGGHMYAAGLTMKKENVEKFSQRFEAYVAENILPEQLVPQIDVDAEIPLSMVTQEFYDQIERLEPFGPCNMKPVFMTRGVCSYSTYGKSSNGTRPVGADNRHLKLEVIDKTDRKSKSGIAFGLGNYFEKIKDGQPFDICYTIEQNVFRGQTSLQLMIKDIHLSPENDSDEQKKTHGNKV